MKLPSRIRLTTFIAFLILCQLSILCCSQIGSIGDTVTKTRILAWLGKTDLSPGNRFWDMPVYDDWGSRRAIRLGPAGALIALPTCSCKFRSIADLSVSSANTQTPVTVLVPRDLFPNLGAVSASLPGASVCHIPLSYRSALGIGMTRSVMVRVSKQGTILSVHDIASEAYIKQ